MKIHPIHFVKGYYCSYCEWFIYVVSFLTSWIKILKLIFWWNHWILFSVVCQTFSNHLVRLNLPFSYNWLQIHIQISLHPINNQEIFPSPTLHFIFHQSITLRCTIEEELCWFFCFILTKTKYWLLVIYKFSNRHTPNSDIPSIYQTVPQL